MLGAIIGDIIGSPFEFSNIKSTQFTLFGQGSNCTDDSILTVATADAIMSDRDYRRAYQDYFHRHPNAGYGGSFVKWANQRETEPYNSWGNGSAMRVSPIGWAFNTLDAVLNEAERSAAVSHNHPEGIKGAQATAAAVFIARTQHDKEAVREFIASGCGYDISRSLDEIRPAYSFKVSCQGTLPVAVRAFLESNDYEDAIRKAVSVGGDSDTIACITGAISHAHYGTIPPTFVREAIEIYLPGPLAKVTADFMTRYNVPV